MIHFTGVTGHVKALATSLGIVSSCPMCPVVLSKLVVILFILFLDMMRNDQKIQFSLKAQTDSIFSLHVEELLSHSRTV